MIDRGEVERLLGWAELGEIAIQPFGHEARMADSPVIAELCRSYLALLDAPVVQADGESLVFAIMAEADAGQSFRLVRVQEG